MKQTKILIIDDDPAIIDVLTLILEDEGYRVKTKLSGKIETEIAQFNPDLILLDMMLSGQDGRDICRSLKLKKKFSSIPIIMISAHPQGKRDALKAGADKFLSKPFDIVDLLATISSALQKV